MPTTKGTCIIATPASTSPCSWRSACCPRLSFLTYSEFWRSNFPVEAGRTFMMAVSCTKAMLVILFFMHVKQEASWKYVLTIPPAIMAVFLMLALVPDIGLRNRPTRLAPERAREMAESPALEKAEAKVDGDAVAPPACNRPRSPRTDAPTFL